MERCKSSACTGGKSTRAARGEPPRRSAHRARGAAPALRSRHAGLSERRRRSSRPTAPPGSSARCGRSTSRSTSRSWATTCSPPGPTALASATRSRRACARTPARARRRTTSCSCSTSRTPRKPLCATLAPGQRPAAGTDDGRVRAAGRQRDPACVRERELPPPPGGGRRAVRTRAPGDARAGAHLRALARAWTSRSRRPGVVSIPLVHGRPGDAAGVRAAAREDPARSSNAAGHEVEQRMTSVIPQLREIDARVRERVRALDREVVLFAVGHLIDDVKREHADSEAVDRLARARSRGRGRQLRGLPRGSRADSADAADEGDARPRRGRVPRALRSQPVRRQRRARARPVVVERNPTFTRLFGRIEFETTLGAAVTDHRHIRAGAIHARQRRLPGPARRRGPAPAVRVGEAQGDPALRSRAGREPGRAVHPVSDRHAHARLGARRRQGRPRRARASCTS